MALYDDASFIFLASAAAGLETKDASKVYNVKPVETLSSTQIVQGGDFSDASQWTLDSDVTIADNKVTFAGSGTQDIFQASGITLGNKKVKVTFTAHDITAGSVNAIFYSSGGTSTVTPSISTNGNHSAVVTIDSSANNNVGLRGSTDFRGKISNFSVREVTAEGADFDISRDANLDATRVGPTGLIEKGREQLLVNTVFAGLTTNGKPTNYNDSVTTGSGSLSPLDSDSTKIKFEVTNASGGRFYVSKTVINTNLICTSVFVDEVTGTAPEIRQIVRSFSSNEGVTRTIIHAALKDGEVVSDDDTVVAGHRYGIVCSYDGSSVHRFGLGTNQSFEAVGSVTLSQPQVEAGIVPTHYIENTSTSATAKAGIKEDEPRFDYPVAGGAPSLLIEPQRQNLMEHSEYMASYDFSTSRVDVTSNHGISPQGVKNSTLVSNTAETGNKRLYGSNSFSVTSGTSYTASVFAKKGTLKKISMEILASSETSIGFDEAMFDLDAGTASYIHGSSSTSAAVIEDFGNGWFRCSITDAPTSSESSSRLYIYLLPDDATTAGDKNYTGSTSENVELFGAQVEEGSSATSYIPCHGAAATRSADTIAALTSIPSVNTSTYTFFAHVSQANTGGTGNRGPRMQNASNDSLMGYFINSSDQKQFFLDPDSAGGGSNRTFSTTDISPASSTQLAGDEVKYAFVINGTSVKCFVDGNTLFDGTASGVVTANRIIFATSDGTPDHIKSVIYFPSAISNLDAMVITDTNYGSYSEMLNSLSYTPHG